MSDYKLTIYANQKSDVGHFFIGVEGPGIDVPISGKYLKDEKIKSMVGALTGGGPGVIEDDTENSTKPGVIKKDFPLSKQQAEKAADYIYNARENPGEYELFGKNCIDFAQGAMDAAGVDMRVDKSFSDDELDTMGAMTPYGAGDEAQRRGRIIDVDKEIKDFRNSENSPFGPHADAGDGDDGGEVADLPQGSGLGFEAEQNVQTDISSSPVEAGKDASGPSEKSRQKARALITEDKDANRRGSIDTMLLKPVEDLTSEEMQRLGMESWRLQTGDPRRHEIEEKRRDFYSKTFGDDPAEMDATGRMIDPAPKRTLPEKPVPLKTTTGEKITDSLKRFADRLAPALDDDGEADVARAVQVGINKLGERLKVDGVAGPKTKAAVTRTLAKHGTAKAEEAFGLGRFQQFAQKQRDTGGSAAALKTTVARTVQPLLGQTPKNVAGEALQESINDLSTKAADEKQQPAPELLKVDGDIGPRTTDAFRLSLAEHGPEKLTKSYGSMLGFG